jgi:uncharacterized protein YfiM (DUF2279 family)
VSGEGRVGASGERLARRLTLGWAAVILVFALLPTHAALSAAVGERETLTTQVGHFIEFAVLAALGLWWMSARERNPGDAGAGGRAGEGPAGGPVPVRSVLGVWAAATAFGALIEVLQVPLAYRSAQVGDLAMDAAGAAAGLLAFSCVRALRGQRGRRHGR